MDCGGKSDATPLLDHGRAHLYPTSLWSESAVVARRFASAAHDIIGLRSLRRSFPLHNRSPRPARAGHYRKRFPTFTSMKTCGAALLTMGTRYQPTRRQCLVATAARKALH